MCCTNGGAFIKVGQHLGSLDYLLPLEYVETMKILHNQAPQSAVSDLFKVLEEDLGKKVSKVLLMLSILQARSGFLSSLQLLYLHS